MAQAMKMFISPVFSLNQRAAARVGLDTLDAAEWERHFAAFAPLPENLPEPLALRYHGHQFRTYNPALGDGRGFLFAQLAVGGTAALVPQHVQAPVLHHEDRQEVTVAAEDDPDAGE